MVSGHFLGDAGQRIFLLLRRPPGTASGCVLVVPPFGEEMNKSRRMATDVASGLVARGVSVLVPDLYGTGDSEGDFADARWQRWKSDLASACHWSGEAGCPVTGLLAIRLGCALAGDALRSGMIPAVRVSVLWQPVLDAGRFLTQFLRLRVAASLMDDDRKESTATLRSRLAAGETLEVAGYGLCPGLAADLEAVDLAGLPSGLGTVHWVEVVRDPDGELPFPSSRLIERARADGMEVESHKFAGEPFWSSTEIVTIPAMSGATIEALASADGGARA